MRLRDKMAVVTGSTRRMGEGIAARVACLASDGAGQVTGCELHISGGLWV